LNDNHRVAILDNDRNIMTTRFSLCKILKDCFLSFPLILLA